MPAPLPMPHVPPSFPSMAMAGGPTARPGGPTVPGIEDGSQTVSPSGHTTVGTEASGQTASPGCQTATLGGPTAMTYVAPSSPASPTSAAPHAAPSTPPARQTQPWHLRLQLHHPRPQSPTCSTTRAALGLRESHRHRLYISSHRQ
jgi:hypothetical protein